MSKMCTRTTNRRIRFSRHRGNREFGLTELGITSLVLPQNRSSPGRVFLRRFRTVRHWASTSLQAVTSEAVATHTSMKENVGVVPLANAPSAFRSKSLTLVDLPGHPRLSPLLSKVLRIFFRSVAPTLTLIVSPWVKLHLSPSWKIFFKILFHSSWSCFPSSIIPLGFPPSKSTPPK